MLTEAASFFFSFSGKKRSKYFLQILLRDAKPYRSLYLNKVRWPIDFVRFLVVMDILPFSGVD